MSWDIFKEKVDVIVNAVNIVGAMGKGLALQFKQVYGQEYFDSYRTDCQKAAGDISAFNSVYTAPDGKTIYNFATKKDWRDPSSLEIIGIGLDKLVAWLGDRDVSIAIPQLGCGCGGLFWNIVKPLIVNKLSSVKANVCLDGVWMKGGKQMDNIIGPFRGEYDFLSNMFHTKVTTDLGTFKCAEAAFQAYKCANKADVEKFETLEGKDAKALGGKRGLYRNGRLFRIALRSDWDNVRLEKMLEVVRAKFSNPALAERLVETGDAELVEINTWNDKFWGAVDENGVLVGENNLGKILMQVRDEINNGDKQEFQAATTNVNAEEKTWNDIFSGASVALSDEQKQVVRDIITDIKFSDMPTTNLIVGNAGVGKTTVLACLQKALCAFFDAQVGADIAICAPTNKACKVLVEKGLTKAETVHSRFLQPSLKNGRLVFQSSAHGCPLKFCIVDEASMLSSYVLDELQKYQKYKKTHFVFVGDNFQLPPVEKTNNDVFVRYGKSARRLTKVFRQAQGSEILDLATALRTKETSFFPTKSCGQVELLPYENAISKYIDALKDYRSAVAIVNSNAERNHVNAHIREKLGYSVAPVEGEHLISVANATNFTNGETFELHDITFCESVTVWLDNEKNGVDGYCVVDRHGVTLLLTEYSKASVYHQQIANVEGSTEAIKYLCNFSLLDQLTGHQPKVETNIAYYGYAITAHKAQGSQWDEVFLLQTQNRGDRDSARWLYTAVTRAAKRLVIADDKNIAHKNWEEIHQILGDNVITHDKKEEEKPMKEATTTKNQPKKEEEKIMKDEVIKIVSDDKMKKKIWTTAEATATQADVIKTYGNPAYAPSIVHELAWTETMMQKAGIKVDVCADGKTLTESGFRTAQGSYISRHLPTVADSVFMTLRGKIVFVQQWQVVGLIGRLNKLGLQFTVNGKVATPPQTTKKTTAAAFTVANKVNRLGEGEWILLRGESGGYKKGQGKSIIILPNHKCAMAAAISGIESNKSQKEHPAVTTGDWYEAHFVILQDDEIIATVYAFIAASSELEARGIIGAWIARNATRANGWSADRNRIPKGIVEYPCVKMLENKSNPDARKALAEALRTANHIEYAEVDVKIDPSDIKRMVKEQCLAFCGNKITSLEGNMGTVMSLVQKFGGTIAALEKKIDTLEADNATLKADKVALEERIAALEAYIAAPKADITAPKAEETRETKAAKTDEPKPEPKPEPTPVVVPEQESEKHEPMKFNRNPGALPDESETEQQTSAPEPAPVQQQPDMTAIEVTKDDLEVIGKTIELPEIVTNDPVNSHAYEDSIKAREKKAARVKVACAALGIKLDELDDAMCDADLFVDGCDHLYDMKAENGDVYVQQTRQSDWKQIKYEGGEIVVH